MCPFNTSIKISVPCEQKPAQTYIVVGPVTIIPYLLFIAPDHLDTLLMEQATSYDLQDVLIDNTDSVGTITYEILRDETGVASLDGSVIQMGDVKQSGAVDIQAAWGEVTTTMTLWVEAAPNQPSAPTTVHRTPYTKINKDGHLRICRGDESYSVLGNAIQ